VCVCVCVCVCACVCVCVCVCVRVQCTPFTCANRAEASKHAAIVLGRSISGILCTRTYTHTHNTHTHRLRRYRAYAACWAAVDAGSVNKDLSTFSGRRRRARAPIATAAGRRLAWRGSNAGSRTGHGTDAHPLLQFASKFSKTTH
jgi:hypothetical protein